MRSIDVSQNGTTPNTVNGNVWIHMKFLQPQHYECDGPIVGSNLYHNPANYYDATHQSETKNEEWVVHIQIVAIPY